MAKKTAKAVTAFKGFDPDLKCRGFQFEVGKSYKVDGKVQVCANGFHSCANPLDVLKYYELIDGSGKPNRFAVVELGGDQETHDEDTKIASAEITIKAELKLPDFIKAAIEYITGLAKDGKDEGARFSSGDYSQLAASGNYSQLAASGYSSQLAASGNSSQLAASGYSSKLAASGDYSQLAASGDYSQLAASGKNSVIASSGINAVASGVEGTWISLAEFNDKKECIGFATGCIGKDGLKPDTFYRAQGGKLVEAA